MNDHERLLERTESYLKTAIRGIAVSLGPEFDSRAAFGELGINSFQVLKIIKRLEEDFGTLPKSLLFESFNVRDLAEYFVKNHGATLRRTIADDGPVAAAIVVPEREAYARADLRDLVRALYERHGREGSVSRGTRVIAPNLFIGSARRGYFHFARANDIVVVYGYTGPDEYVATLLDEIQAECSGRNQQLNILTADPIEAIGGRPYSATPFGVLQRICDLRGFSLDGGPMRRLRYQVTKFRKTGACRTEEYRCGTSAETDKRIAEVIDLWCESRTAVNPLVHEVRAEILNGALAPEHRLFLTYLDDVLQNAILITSMSGALNGYLMDLEFYRPSMPLGGLESAIVEIIGTLAREGCDLLSLGGTYGCKIESSPTADPEIDALLGELRARDIFNDAGNLQFKNKFRPENRTIFLCRPAGSGRADNVTDIIMMIADPKRDDRPAVAPPVAPAVAPTLGGRDGNANTGDRAPGRTRSRGVTEQDGSADFDLSTDSWALLEMPAIQARMRYLHAQVQQPVNVNEILRESFPFAHVVLTGSGQAAESCLFRAMPTKGVVPQNLLFPSTIFHQIDNGFEPLELPHPSVFDVRSPDPRKAEMNLEALEAEVSRRGAAIACVCIEVGNNASGGHPVSARHLRDVKALLGRHAIPLVVDATRAIQNARLLVDRREEPAVEGLWNVVRELSSCADVLIGSLTKEHCVNRGGIVACNDPALFARLRDVLDRESAGLDVIDRKLIALSLANRPYIESRVGRKIEQARRLSRALSDRGVPVAHAGGGHCVLIDAKDDPGFVTWLRREAGIRAASHAVGMQRQTAINDLVRLAIPIGLTDDDIGRMIERIGDAQRRRREGEAPRATAAAVERPDPERPRRDVAVVGMAGRYPKARNVGELWRNLAAGRDCIEELPAERHERRRESGSAARYRGGFVDDVDRFDSLFFNISPREAEALDPQERLFLEVAWEAIEDAGYYPEGLVREGEPRNIGVFVGAVWSMYQILGVEERRAGHRASSNSFLWSIANRVSYWMNLSGPSMTVDTACSSSLTALHLACEAIGRGDCVAALVGGVNLDLHQAKFDINSSGGALSPDGVCRSFGKGANGYVAGEGIGALLLKPLDRAEQDGDHVYGVIRAAVVNHGGRTSGYFVPNPAAQASVVQAALSAAGVSARSIGYVEAHGTGTELGDPIEITGLTAAFGGADVERQTCAIGSIKTNIGHLEAAAGVVGITKVLLQMQHRTLVPSLHSAERNPLIDFDRSPFYVVQKAEEWHPKESNGVAEPLRAGVSSFGAGGANAHVILESHEPPPREREESGEWIFPLSARNEEQLRATALRLAEFLRENDPDLGDVSFTLQQGRKSFEHRVAVVARSKEALLDRLMRFLDGKSAEGTLAGHVKQAESVTRLLNGRERQELVRMLSQGREAVKLAGLWAEGLLADWQGLASDGRRRVALPTYPFAGRRHWVGGGSPAGRHPGLPAQSVHPMVDSNVSTFERQLFRKTFHEGEFFIHDHLVSDVPTLPGVAYLELARKAGELAAGKAVRRIQNILWVSPIAVRNGQPQEVFIELKPAGASVQFEVYSEDGGRKTLHSQGKLLYTNREEGGPERVDLEAVRARCTQSVSGETAYRLFGAAGLSLGPSFRVLQKVDKNDQEALGVLRLSELRHEDLDRMLLHPALLDGSLQAGVAARLGDAGGEMLVPYSIGEVEILDALPATCYSYVTEAKTGSRESRVQRSNVLIVDESGRVVVRIRESTGVPLLDVHGRADEPTRLYYAYDWEPAPLPAGDHAPPTVLVFDEDGQLRDLHESAIMVRPGPEFRRVDDRAYEIDPSSRNDFVRLVQAVPVADVCYAWAGERGAYPFLFLCQALVQAKRDGDVQLLYAHSGGALQEAMTGFVNTLRTEHPKLICKTIEWSGTDSIRAELRGRMQDAVAVRRDGDQRLVRRLRRLELEPAGGAVRDRGVYLITGGAGGLGMVFAEFLARRFHARLVLTGRSQQPAARFDALRSAGADVLYVAADVSKPHDVERVVNEAIGRFGAIHGVIHAAGVVRDSLVRNKTAEEMAAVLAPKIDGTLLLDEATKSQPLDFFVLFSSLAAVTGNPGQSDYGLANAFLDAFAAARERQRAAGERPGRSLSINWALWADGGMRPDEATERALRNTVGMKPLSAEAGTEAFLRGLASGRSQLVVVEGVAQKLEAFWGLGKRVQSEGTAPKAGAAAPVADLEPWLQKELARIVMSLLKLEAADVSTTKILLDLGFDSIGLTTFANAINEEFALDITPVLFFDHPSIQEIAKHLSDERGADLLRARRGGVAAGPAPLAETERAQPALPEARKRWVPSVDGTELGHSLERRFVERPVAVVGMSGVMPQSEDLDEFWENLEAAKDLVTLIPADRWRWEDYYGDPLREPNKTNARWGAFMREIDKFDPLFFGMSPREAQMMDPQQRIFLEHVWKAVEDSGHKVSDLAGTKTGVFVGVATNDYIDVMNTSGAVLDGYSASGNSHSVLANRVSFLLGLRGPSAPLDTACSSSLVALHRALESIHTGSCEMAIVGGVQVMLTPAAFISFSSAGMLSPDGKCKTFDKSANGYVRGEGCGVIFLKSLATALADGDHVYAVVKATAENHGGRVTAMTAPNPAAQTELLIEAYEKAEIDPATVGFIECHGTGTSLGDPIEVQALTKAFSELYRRHGSPPPARPHVGLSSVKTNIGHLETAAGIAGILKTLLAIKHASIPANVHLKEVNPYIRLEGTPFFIARELTPWDRPVDARGVPLPRRAGVSSFGFGGANAHVVFEEHITAARGPLPSAPQLIVLSAKNADRLRDYAEALLAHLDEKDGELSDLAYTLQVGRDEMPERLALVVRDGDDLRQKLRGFLAGVPAGEVHHGSVGLRSTGESVDERAVHGAAERRDLSRLAELWVTGEKIDWRLLHDAGVPRRVPAPTYPFARERYWFEGSERRAATAAARLHPLVHVNTSTFEEQRFSTRFSGAEFYLADHVVGSQKTLPGVAYLEMARSAGEMAAGRPVRAIRNLTWESPLVVGGDAKTAEITLTPGRREVDFAVRTGKVTHCRGQLEYAGPKEESERLDIVGIRDRCKAEVVTRRELYPFLSAGGLNLGRSFQIVESISGNENEALAVLVLPEHLKSEADQFWLHPSLMDGALHTAIGLLRTNGMDAELGLPYAVREVRILGSLRDLRYGYATWRLDPNVGVNGQKVTFHLLDGNGQVLVRLNDFSTKSLRPAVARVAETPKAADERVELERLVPVWSLVRQEGARAPATTSTVLLSGSPAQCEWLRTERPNARLVDARDVPEALTGGFEELVWFAPEASEESWAAQQERGLLALFRIVKELLRLGYGTKTLKWTIVTERTQGVTPYDEVQPAHAGIAGFVGSLAKEYPHWNLRAVDIESLEASPARECLASAFDPRGDALAHRRGEWFRQTLARMTSPPAAEPAYRQGGVYVVIGGAGGLGEAWTRHVIERYRANVVWIGRRDYDARIDAKITRLSELGPAPLYVTADAADRSSLERARETIRNLYPAIHGVVHSAVVLRDQSLARMDEAAFRESLAAKTDATVNMDGTFGEDALDFVLFFSSIVSFLKTPGQANYAAGCSFADAFAHWLRKRRRCRVKIMNWGYWGSVGVVSDEAHNRIMRSAGFGSIEPGEGMKALQELIGSDLHQLAFLKTYGDRATAALDLKEAVAYHARAARRGSPRPPAVLAGEASA